MALKLESVTGGEPREVKISDLEKEISALWRSLAEKSEGEEAVTRATALTLLVYVESEEAAQEVGNLVAALTEQNPCRAVVMIAQPGAQPAGFRASISAHCHLPSSGRKQVCCEQITVTARGDALRDLDHVVLPLTVSGLPVYLWWRTERFDPPRSFGQILRIASHIIVDSARFSDPELNLAGLGKRIEELSDHASFLDLNWARITPWRELIAQCFDGSEAREYLDRLTRVRIEYEAESPRRAAQGAQALLLTGWLAARLKWQPVKSSKNNGTRSFLMKSARGEVEIQLVGRPFEGGGKGVCFSISLETSGTPPATFSLARGTDGRNVRTQAEVKGHQPITRTVRLEVLDEVRLVNEELQYAHRDWGYEESLGCVVRMLQV